MNLISRTLHSSVGKKYIMAISGAAMFGFVVAHLIGNLQIFIGREAINRYGHFLQSNMEIVWPARLGLLVMVGLHIWAAIRLSKENKAARPVAYASNLPPVVASYASRTMLMSGLIILSFIVYHLLHFTVQVPAINLTGQKFVDLHDDLHRHDVYGMMVLGFSNPWVSLFYIIGMALLCLHLSHGVSAMFQSLGWKKKEYACCIDGFARAIAIFLFVGYASIPISIMLGLVK